MLQFSLEEKIMTLTTRLVVVVASAAAVLLIEEIIVQIVFFAMQIMARFLVVARWQGLYSRNPPSLQSHRNLPSPAIVLR